MFRRIFIAIGAAALLMQPAQAKADTGDVILGVIGGIILKSAVDNDRRQPKCSLRHHENIAIQSRCDRVGRAPRRGYYSPEEYEDYNRRSDVLLPAYSCNYYKFVDKYNRVFYKEICQ